MKSIQDVFSSPSAKSIWKTTFSFIQVIAFPVITKVDTNFVFFKIGQPSIHFIDKQTIKKLGKIIYTCKNYNGKL